MRGPSFTVTWGSDASYRYLSAFTLWVKRTLFFPVKDVGVQVEVSGPAPNDLTSLAGCKACLKRLEESELLSCITAVSWRDIESFNLKSIVSCPFFVSDRYLIALFQLPFKDRRLHLLATSVRGAICMCNTFSNGQSKSIATDMSPLFVCMAYVSFQDESPECR